MVPHDGRWRRPRESHGRLELAHSGQVVGSRESDGFPNGAGLVVVASENLGGSCHCEWPNAREGERQEEAKGGTRDRTTKPSRDWLWVVVRKPRLIFDLVATVATRQKVTTKTRAYWRGCERPTYVPFPLSESDLRPGRRSDAPDTPTYDHPTTAHVGPLSGCFNRMSDLTDQTKKQPTSGLILFLLGGRFPPTKPSHH